jgi:uncharacterized UPF0160 family protein
LIIKEIKKLNNMTKIIATHHGKFHADDVCAVSALALLIDGPIEVIRTRDTELLAKADFVVDVGGVFDEKKNCFDHHQEEGAGERENGIPYAAFGLVWKTYGEKLCGSLEVAKIIDKDMVSYIDATDNGFGVFFTKFENINVYGFDSLVNAFVSTWKEEDRDLDVAFAELVRFTKALLAREIMRVRAKVEAKDFVEKAYENAEDKRIIVLDGQYPACDFLSRHPEPLYFIRPRIIDNKWSLETVRDDSRSFVNRKDLPKAWSAKKDAEFAEISGVPDAVFCHKNLFLAVANSKDGAIALAKKAIEA